MPCFALTDTKLLSFRVELVKRARAMKGRRRLEVALQPKTVHSRKPVLYYVRWMNICGAI